ncbi:MAG: serine hydrolase [Anaerolineales bacterium]|jgi:CubicO group peptidase (beta-lactamase class C family)
MTRIHLTHKITNKIRKFLPLFLATAGAILWLVMSSGCSMVDSPVGNQGLEPAQNHNEEFRAFTSDLDTIRQDLKIPGMSAAIVQNQELVWASGFGYADLEKQVKASPDTPYGLASVTKPVAAVLVMQLVEQGLIDLNAPVNQYGVDAGNDEVTVRNLLTHTSEGNPGTIFHYNGNRYALLGGVIEGTTGRSFAELLSEKVLLPLEMESTALNPISDWGAHTINSIEDFQRMLGLGADFRYYPDVYSHLARPYQFDEDYRIIPGMYHLIHSPAAGLISSVGDLARFDIALDQGLLLDQAARVEMFTPAYSTYHDRQDLMYGLGWYVQEFEGLHLLWHTGRWPPSTSALYLKVPEKNLTFIVLANTDNLSVPFYGIGNGDVSQSALALSFMRYFVYPQLLGKPLPEIDWHATEQVLVEQISAIEDPDSRRLLERESWSYRQVFASVGQADQAAKLLRVNRISFPGSSFRFDELFTSLPGKYPVLPPVPAASTFSRIGLGIASWFVLVLISMIFMVAQLHSAENISGLGKLIWLAATLFLGPIAILIHTFTQSASSKESGQNGRLALRASLLTITGYTIAWIGALTLLRSFGTEPNPLIILGSTYFFPLFVGLFLFRIPLQVAKVGSQFSNAFKQNLLTEIITFNLVFAVFFSMTWLVSSRLMTSIPHPSSPFFWAMLSFIAGIGLGILFPLHYWMIRRGNEIPTDQISEGAQHLSFPTLRTSWPALLATLGIMLAALVATISQIS